MHSTRRLARHSLQTAMGFADPWSRNIALLNPTFITVCARPLTVTSYSEPRKSSPQRVFPKIHFNIIFITLTEMVNQIIVLNYFCLNYS